MTKHISISGIEKATKKEWGEWLSILEDMGAKDLTHKEIARKLYDLLDGKLENHGWWAQGITIAYEQHTGRRVPGQRSDGTFECSVSKTFAGNMDDVYQAWLSATADLANFNNIEVIKRSSSETEKWRNWRCNLADGSKVVVGINQKNSDKAMLGLAHQVLPSSEDAEAWRNYWREFLAKI